MRPAAIWLASTFVGMAARDHNVRIHSNTAILPPSPSTITSGSPTEGMHLGGIPWAGVPNCPHIFRPYPKAVNKAEDATEAGTVSTISFGFKFAGYQTRRFQILASAALTKERFQERVDETNGRPEQASPSHNGPV